MYSLLRHVGFRQSLTAEAPALLTSLLVAELFYKFHSFVLECAAFLVTWMCVSFVFASVGALVRRVRAPQADARD
jgi:hypothetical protein